MSNNNNNSGGTAILPAKDRADHPTISEGQPQRRNTNLDEISAAVTVDTDADFNKSSFALKRTRSMGLFDLGSMNLNQSQQTNSLSVGPILNDSVRQTSSPPPIPDDTGLIKSSMIEHDEHVSPPSIATTATATSSSLTSSSVSDDFGSGSSIASSAPGTPELTAPVLDDSVIQYEPSRHVDYLSHNWKESDISSSWRYIVLRRKDMANSARLENASWRTWTKAKYNLKTVAPESVNWLKDYDVTWLYGPLYDEPHHSYSFDDNDDNDDSREKKNGKKTATVNKMSNLSLSGSSTGTVTPTSSSPAATTTNNNNDNDNNNNHDNNNDTNQPLPCKPILKKRSASQVILSSLPFGTCSSDWDSYTTNYLRHHNYRHRPLDQRDNNISYYVNQQYQRSPISSFPQDDYFRSSSATPSLTSSLRSGSPGSKTASSSERHIHFNNRVEQCIAVDISSGESEDDYDDDVSSGSETDNTDTDSDSDNETLELSSRGRSRTRAGGPGRDISARGAGGRQYRKHHRRNPSLDSDDSDSDEEPGLFLMVRSSSSASISKSNNHRTISLLPATTLKYQLDDEEKEANDAKVANAVAHTMSHNSMNYRHGYNTKYDYSSVYVSPNPSPSHSPRESIGTVSPVSQTTETNVNGELVSVAAQSSSNLLEKVEDSASDSDERKSAGASTTSIASGKVRSLASSLWTWKK